MQRSYYTLELLRTRRVLWMWDIIRSEIRFQPLDHFLAEVSARV
jgi:hypothetical protein